MPTSKREKLAAAARAAEEEEEEVVLEEENSAESDEEEAGVDNSGGVRDNDFAITEEDEAEATNFDDSEDEGLFGSVDDVEDGEEAKREKFCLAARLIDVIYNPRREEILKKMDHLVDDYINTENHHDGMKISFVDTNKKRHEVVSQSMAQEIIYMITVLYKNIEGKIVEGDVKGALMQYNDFRYAVANRFPKKGTQKWTRKMFEMRLNLICNLLDESKADLQLFGSEQTGEKMMGSFLMKKNGKVVYDGESFDGAGELSYPGGSGIDVDEKFLFQDMNLGSNNGRDKNGHKWELVAKEGKTPQWLMVTEKEWSYGALRGITEENPGIVVLTKGFPSSNCIYTVVKLAKQFGIEVLGE